MQGRQADAFVAMQSALPVTSTGTAIIGGNQLVAMNTEVRKEHC